MKNDLLSASVLSVGLVVSSLIIANGAFAQTAPPEIQFPVAELGGCEDKDACKVYCDDVEHIDACIAFAEKNGLMSEDEINVAKKFIKAGAKGPGGCTGKDACEAYCDDISHIDACIAFAEKTGILPPEELAEAKQVQAAIAKGVKPPACRNKKECDVYCEDPSHMKECITFGEAAGFLGGRELEDAKKMLIAIDKGAVPPPCRGREACEVYCTEPDHMEACMTFALAAGFMTPEEAKDSEKMLTALKKGVRPPACRGKEECDAYCSDSAHADECIQFAVAAGFMTEKEAEMAKRTGGKGPGGCTGKDACEVFCGNPDNQEVCINFAKENGMISEEEVRQMEEGQKQFRESVQNMPEEVENCLRTALGDEAFEKVKSGRTMPSREIGDTMGSCFSQMGPPLGQEGGPREGQDQGQRPPEGLPSGEYRGPGGCSTGEECKVYCAANPEACQGFTPPGGGPGYQTGPVPGTEPIMPPPPEGGTSDASQYQQQYQEQYQKQLQEQYQQQYQQQYQEQYQQQYQQTQPVPGTESMMPTSGEGGGEGGGTALPPLPPPIESTAPQSALELIVDNSLAAIASAFKKLGF